MNKEHNFISAVVYIDDSFGETVTFLQTLETCLSMHFQQYEIILVHVVDLADMSDALREWAGHTQGPITVVDMSDGQTHEQCMNAGLDLAIGDYVYEFDSTALTYQPELIYQAYELALAGNDIVNVCPNHPKGINRHLFYWIFNRFSDFRDKLRTNVFRLVSRRAINRTHAMNENLPYRKASYAASGLSQANLEFTSIIGDSSVKKADSLEFALDSLILYTGFGYHFSFGFAFLMLLGTIAMSIYTVVIYLIGHPVNGWTTTMLALTAGLTGLFGILTMILKYLSLILKLLFQKQKYLVKNIEKF